MSDFALDPVVHELNRLRICAALAPVSSLEFATLRDISGLSDSALSKHLKRLTDVEYVTVSTGKPAGRGRPKSWVALTTSGQAAYTAHVQALQSLTGTS